MFADRVYQTSTSTGSAVLILDGGAPVQYVAFSTAYTPGAIVPILARGQSGGQWQTGTAEYQSGPDRLAWLTYEDGSAGKGVAVSFGAGIKDVKVNASAAFLNDVARKVVYEAANKDVVVIPAGSPCAVHSSGVGIVRASAADNTRLAVGISRYAIGTGFAGDVQTDGPLTLADWTAVVGAASLDPRATYFLDPTTPGRLTRTPPTVAGQILQIMGTAVAPDTLDVALSVPILL